MRCLMRLIGKGKFRFASAALYLILSIATLSSGKLAIAFGFATLAALVLFSRGRFDPFSPIALVSHMFGIYFLAVMAFADVQQKTALYVVATIVLFVLVYLSLPVIYSRLVDKLTADLRLRRCVRAKVLTLQFIGFALFLLTIRLAGFGGIIEVLGAPLQYRFFMMQRGMTYLTLFLHLLILFPVLVLWCSYYAKRISWKTPVFSLALALLYAICTGERGTVIFLVAQIVIIRHFLYRRLSFKLAVAAILIFVPLIAIWGQWRMLAYSGDGADSLSSLTVSDFVSLTASRADAIYRFDELVEKYDLESRTPHWGLSYVALPIQAIPRSFWPNKPRMPNVEMTSIIGRDDPYLDIAFDFGIFGEAFINFLWAGPPFIAMLLYLFVSPLQDIYDRPGNHFRVLLYVIIWFFPAAIIISGLAQTLIFVLVAIGTLFILRIFFFVKTSARVAFSS